MSGITPQDWIESFIHAMKEIGRRERFKPSFIVDVCEEHADCISIQVLRQHEHVQWKENAAVETARLLAARTH